MAVAAETIERVRPPESEIYGRSLSTIQRLGASAIGKSQLETIHSSEAEQARVEFYTSVEEGFGTDMELGGGLEVRDFDNRSVIDGRVMAKDLKTAVSDMTEAGLICAEDKYDKETNRSNPDRRFLPQLNRSRWDHDNALTVDKMAAGETTYNTRIVISPFPEEAAAESGDDYWRNIGYVPHLKRGFVQLYHANEKGELIAGSLSFDGSDKKRLRELFGKCGVEIPEAELTDNWLQYAITDTLSETEAKELAVEIANEAGAPGYTKTTNTVEVTSDHRAIMDTVFDESYVHVCESSYRGYQTPGARKLVFELADKAHGLKSHYKDALYRMRANGDHFSEDDTVILHELLVYSTIEMMRALHVQTEKLSTMSDGYIAEHLDPRRLLSLDPAAFQNLLGSFGAEGARHNRTYSACGLSISLGEANSPGEAPQYAFGGLSREELSWHGGKIKKGKCVNCNKDTNVGVKNWCKSCIKC